MKNRKYEIIKGICCSYCVTFIVICILAAIYTYTQIGEESMPIVMKLTMIVSIAIGAFTASKKLRNKGWFNGIIIGMVYTLILVIIGTYLNNDMFYITKSIENIIINMLVGSFFGIIGVNVKK